MKKYINPLLIIYISIMSLSQFDKVSAVIDNTIRLEGGFSNNAADPGGATKFGITLKTYQTLVNHNATAKDVMAISINEAHQFYKTYFFYKYGIEKLPEPVWDIVFDMCVNHGPTNAFNIVQIAMGKLGIKTEVTGVNGPAMQVALADVNPAALRGLIIAQRASFYASIIRKNPKMKIFATGWFTNRVAYFADTTVLT